MSQATWRAGRRDDLTASQVSFLANEAYLEVASVYPRALSEQTAHLSVSSGERSVALPASCDEVLHLSWLGSNDSLALIEIDEVDSRDTGAGTPRAFAFYGAGLELWPTPASDATLQLRYRAQPTELSQLTHVPSLATPWRAAIVPKLEEKLWSVYGNSMGAALAQQRYLALVSSLKNDDARRQASLHPQGVRVYYDEPARRAPDADW